MNYRLLAVITVPTLLVACVIVAILGFFDVPFDSDTEGPLVVAEDARDPAPPEPDVTEAFREFASRGEPFTPEWLVRVREVTWQVDGSLWARAAMPSNPAERQRTLETICERLTAYVDEVGRPFHGVSVRAVDGAELLTRADRATPCRLSTPG